MTTSAADFHRRSGHGRDLVVLTLEIASGTGSRTFDSVICPREHRAEPAERCETCEDGGGPIRDPSAQPGYVACRAAEGPVSASDPGASAADRTPVSAIMATAVVAVRADVPLPAARRLLLGRGIDGVAVVDEQGRPIGMVTLGDLCRAGADALEGPRPVAEVMVRRALAVSEAASIAEVAGFLEFEELHLVPVVGRAGRVVGMVTALDVVRWLAAQDGRGARHLP
jgi:CBS domain-containing protein